MAKKLTMMEKETKARIKKHGKPYKPSKKEYMQEAKRDRELEKQPVRYEKKDLQKAHKHMHDHMR